jgi:hypothetical protein
VKNDIKKLHQGCAEIEMSLLACHNATGCTLKAIRPHRKEPDIKAKGTDQKSACKNDVSVEKGNNEGLAGRATPGNGSPAFVARGDSRRQEQASPFMSANKKLARLKITTV